MQMLHKCANPVCTTQFRQSRSGKLFQFESAPSNNARQQERMGSPRNRAVPRVEHYWLCDLCFPRITLVFDDQAGLSMAGTEMLTSSNLITQPLPTDNLIPP